MELEFKGFNSIGRLSRPMVITEKIDGTNAQLYIAPGNPFEPNVLYSWETPTAMMCMYAGSRSRWITPEADNHGFARWAYEHATELQQLGEGRHFGEWWGCGIQRKYGLKEKRWSLFNVHRWCLNGQQPQLINPDNKDPNVAPQYQGVLPACVGLVPVLYTGTFDTTVITAVMADLHKHGSFAAPGFMDPEGVVIFHSAKGVLFKKTFEKDAEGKNG